MSINTRIALLLGAAVLTTSAADAQRYYARQRINVVGGATSNGPVTPDPTPTPTPTPTARSETSITVNNVSGTGCIQIAELEVYAKGVNVALAANGGRASGTSPYSGESNVGKAIDGVKPAGYPNIYHSECVGGSYLRVDFARPVEVESVVIYGRADGFGERDVFTYQITGTTGGRSGAIDARSGRGTSIPS